MGENKSGKLHVNENRPALGDITNQVGKKDFSSVSHSSDSKTLSGKKRSAEDSDADSQFWKQVALVVEKLEKERCEVVAKCPKVENEAGLAPLKGGKTYRLQNLSGDVGSVGGNSATGHEIKEPSASVLDSIDLDEDQDLRNVVDLSEAVAEGSKCCKESCDEVGKGSQVDVTRVLSDLGEMYGSPEELDTQVLSDDGKSLGVDGMTSCKSESAVTSRLAEAQETRSFGLERCTLLRGDGSSNLADGMDLLKSCSCSFCMKAAYIWSDLHYQDIKGRISILSNSQKEANQLAQRYSVENEMGSSQGISSNVAKIETDLMSRWQSLFLHMENVFAGEGSQLEANFHALKDLRENYKMNLEMINGMPPDVQLYSSDASDHTIS